MPGFKVRRGRATPSGGGGGGGTGVGPHASWTGPAATGALTPTFRYNGVTNTRPGGTVAVQWNHPTKFGFSSDIVIGVDADAKGGVQYVDFFGDIALTRVTTPTYRIYTDINGTTTFRRGYWITLTYAQFAAISLTGAINIYAKAVPNSGTIASRTLGLSNDPANGDYLMVLYPRPATPVKSYQIQPSAATNSAPSSAGGVFKTLDYARAQFVIDQPSSCEFVFMETNTYDLPAWNGTAWEGHTGYAVFRTANSGVTATLTAARTFTSQPTGAITDLAFAWSWCPFMGRIEFRGSGIVIDVTNWSILLTRWNGVEFARHWLNGCTVIDTIGRDTSHWNKQNAPGLQGVATSFDPCTPFITDIITTETQVATYQAPILYGMEALNGGSNHDMCCHVADCYERGIDTAYYTTARNAMTVSYTGAGTASLFFNVNTRQVDCRIDTGSGPVSIGGSFPSTISTWQLNGGAKASDTLFSISQLVAAINAIPSGNWHAVLLDNTWPTNFCFGDNVDVLYTLTSTAQNVITKLWAHTEWHHAISTMENGIIRDNIVRRSYFDSQIMEPESGLISDFIVAGNAFEMRASIGGTPSFAGKHVVVKDNYYDSDMVLREPSFWDADGLVTRNVCRSLSQYGGGWSIAATVTDNAVASALPAAGTGFVIANTDTDAVTDKAGGDFRPAGTVLSTLKNTIDTLDQRGAARGATSPVGPWVAGGAAPVYQF